MHTEWTPELEAALAAPFPEDRITWLEKKSLKTGKVTKIATVSWYHYAQRLDDAVGVGGWQSRISHMHEAGGKLVIAVELTVLGVTKTNVGDEPDDSDSFGSVSTNAKAQAFKRACTMFGIARDQLYAKKGRATKPAPSKKPPVDRGASPIIPSGDHKGKSLDDPSLTMSYLIQTASAMEQQGKTAWATKFQAEIDRRKAAAGVAAS